MSEKNVELARRYRDAYNMRDIEAMLACCDPNIAYHAAWPGVAPAVYHGHDGMREWDGANEKTTTDGERPPAPTGRPPSPSETLCSPSTSCRRADSAAAWRSRCRPP